MVQNSTGSKRNSSHDAASSYVEYLYGELVISLGFFFVFLLELLALQYCHGDAGRSTVQEEEWGGTHAFGFYKHSPVPSCSNLCQAWWYSLLVSALGRQGQDDLCVRGQPVQESQGNRDTLLGICIQVLVLASKCFYLLSCLPIPLCVRLYMSVCACLYVCVFYWGLNVGPHTWYILNAQK